MSYRHYSRDAVLPSPAPLPIPAAASSSCAALWDLKLGQMSLSLFISVFLLLPQDVILGHKPQRLHGLISWSPCFVCHIHCSENTGLCPNFPCSLTSLIFVPAGWWCCYSSLYYFSQFIVYCIFVKRFFISRDLQAEAARHPVEFPIYSLLAKTCIHLLNCPGADVVWRLSVFPDSLFGFPPSKTLQLLHSFLGCFLRITSHGTWLAQLKAIVI